jgi:hypothetical protein
MKLASLCAAVTLAACVCSPVRGNPTQARSSIAEREREVTALFSLTRVREMRLTLTPQAWKAMQPPREPGFGRGGFGRPAAGGAPGAGAPGSGQPATSQRGGLAGRMGLDYPEVRATLVCAGKTYPDIGLRYKGNGTFLDSRGTLKRPLKLDINKFVKGQRFFGVKTVNLNNNVTDPSYMREVLAYQLFRQAGVPAPRTTYARVYLTVPGEHQDRYLGLYTIVEQVDEEFFQRHFGTEEGLLLKPDFVTGLPYLGDDWQAYEKPYRPRTKASRATRERFIALTKLLKEADDPTFQAQIGGYLDLDEFARFLAANVLLSNLDSILVLGQNYYLYLPSETGKFYWLPWDLDRAFGNLLGTPEQLAKLSIRRPHADNNRLIERLLAVPEVNRLYRRHLQVLTETVFRADRVGAMMATIGRTIRPAVAAESPEALRLFDVSLSEKEAPQLSETSSGGGRGRGPRRPAPAYLKRFVAVRNESVREQLAGRSDGIPTRSRNFFGGGGGRGGFGGGPGGGGQRGAFLAAPLLRAADADSDQKLTAEEFRDAAGRWFTRWDANGDAFLVVDEFRYGLNQIVASPGAAGPQSAGNGAEAEQRAPGPRRSSRGPGGFVAPSLLRVADADSDGKLTADELRNAVGRWFPQWDADKSAALDTEEFGKGLSQILGPPPPSGTPAASAQSATP